MTGYTTSKLGKKNFATQSKLTKFNSRYGSRLMSGMGKFGRSQYKNKSHIESYTYSPVRDTDEPRIFRNGKDVTPLVIKIDPSEITTNDNNEIERNYTAANNLNDSVLSQLEEDDTISISTQATSYSTNSNIKDSNNDRDAPTIDNNNKNTNASNNMSNINNNNMNKKNLTIVAYPNDKDIDLAQNIVEYKKIVESNPSILDEEVNVLLSETETQYLFTLPSLTTGNDDLYKEDRELITTENEIYTKLKEKHLDSDLFTERCSQTLNRSKKERGMYAALPKNNDISNQCSKWLVYDALNNKINTDTYNVRNLDCNNKNKTSKVLDLSENKNILNQMAKCSSFKKNLVYMERAIVQNIMAEQQILYRIHNEENDEHDDEFESEDMSNSMQDVTAKIDKRLSMPHQENNNNAHIPLTSPNDNVNPVNDGNSDNKNIPSDISNDNNDNKESEILNKLNTPNLQLLWRFTSPSQKNDKDKSETDKESSNSPLQCLAMDYNPLNEDLIVCGYGSDKFGNTLEGKIMFWTLKNPSCPERIYELPRSVTCLNFSRTHPYLLAVGLFDGSVLIYDIRINDNNNNPILKSELGKSKHNTAVWNVSWEQATDKQDMSTKEKETKSNLKLHQRQKLYSIASDGNIKQWSMKKGFLSTNIMSLKRVPNLAARRGSVIDNTIRSRQGSGLCFDFPTSSSTQYYVGTEDGIVHKCSVSYNEQVLRTYYGHVGPVYSIMCSPFDTDKFITCSFDWTVKIWDQANTQPLLSLASDNTELRDVKWSPFDSCIFGSCNSESKIQIWNLDVNKKDPIISHCLEDNLLCNKLIFAPKSPCIFAGLNNGDINVYRINGINCNPSFKNDVYKQQQRLNTSLQAED